MGRLLNRRVETTRPVDRNMIINALHSGKSVLVADFEDANSPTWANTLDGQATLPGPISASIYGPPATAATPPNTGQPDGNAGRRPTATGRANDRNDGKPGRNAN